MKNLLSRTALALLAAGALQAQDWKLNGLIIAWYTQPMNSNLRWNEAPKAPAGMPQGLAYYSLGGTKGSGTVNPYNESGFSLRRAELYLSAKVTEELSANVMWDPNQSAPQLFDAYLTWKPGGAFEVKAGQFKPIGYEASLVSAADLLFTDRAQVVRYATDYRDRGVMATLVMGDKAFGARLGLGVFNGSSDRQNDASAQKDAVLRLDVQAGEAHRFGAYGQYGTSNQADKGAQKAAFGAATATNLVPTPEAIYDNRDRTSTFGGYYAFTSGGLHLDAELTTGLMGRRNPAYLMAEAKRQHLDQRFLGYQLTGAYSFGRHVLRARYDVMDYNAGDAWYTTFNPYRETAPGVLRPDGGDYTPRYTEATVGYTFVVDPAKTRRANLKLDYIFRSKNFLAPRPGQTGEQGGDSLVAAFQVYF